jgi:F-type H+-transporting ATPase subunit a
MNIGFNNIASPLDQFEIRDLISIDAPILFNIHLSLSNIGVYLCLAAFVVMGLNLLATNNNKVVSNN